MTDDSKKDTERMHPLDEPSDPPLVIPRGYARATLLAAFSSLSNAVGDVTSVAEACARGLDEAAK
jgi:hypothetical protein